MKKKSGLIPSPQSPESRNSSVAGEAPPRAAAEGDAGSTDPQAQIRKLRAQLAAALDQIDELRASAETDFLLEILNRRGFEREFGRSVAYIKRYQATGALIMLDLDRLKPINDTYGHAAGDEVLKAVAAELLRHVRASDVLARLGGDEFVLLLWHLGEADARTKAAALETAIDGLRFDFDGHVVAAGASAGIAMLGPDSDPTLALVEADRAMYARKAERRHAEPRQGLRR
jgi:diguanylate cyclase (GGDEF)-like protein